MDKAELVRRNERLTEAYHQTSLKHQLRALFLKAISHYPIKIEKPDKERILLIRPDHLGDVLLTTPAIRALRKAKPDVEIHVLVGEWSKVIVDPFSEIDVIKTVSFPGFVRDSHNQNLASPYKQLQQLAHKLRGKYTSAVILRPDHWWGAMLAFWAGIPERIGYDLSNVKPFLTTVIEHEHKHAVIQNMNLVESWTGEIAVEDISLDYPVKENDAEFIHQLLIDEGLDLEKPIVCIHAGSGSPWKAWTTEKWAKVADGLLERVDIQIVLTGTQAEKTETDSIIHQMQSTTFNLAGKTNIPQLAALYKRSKTVLGVDSGALHLAVAVSTPTLTLYGPADPIEFAGWGAWQRHVAITSNMGCRPCRILDWGDDDPEFHPCVSDISVQAVRSTALRLITQIGV